MSEKNLKTGRYRHYKGGEYELLGLARHSEDQSELVLYKSLKDSRLWVRPFDVFFEDVEVDGDPKKRFEYISETKTDDFEDKYKRALAEMQNLRKAMEIEKINHYKFATEALIGSFIQVFDNLKLSINSLAGDQLNNPWVSGVKLVIKQFENILKNNGVEEVDLSSGVFDHNTMDALSGDGPKIKTIHRSGYRLNGKLIQAAQVELE